MKLNKKQKLILKYLYNKNVKILETDNHFKRIIDLKGVEMANNFETTVLKFIEEQKNFNQKQNDFNSSVINFIKEQKIFNEEQREFNKNHKH